MAQQENTIVDLAEKARIDKDMDKLLEIDDFYVVLCSLVATYDKNNHDKNPEAERAILVQEIDDVIKGVKSDSPPFSEDEQVILQAEYLLVRELLENGDFDGAQRHAYETADIIADKTTMIPHADD